MYNTPIIIIHQGHFVLENVHDYLLFDLRFIMYPSPKPRNALQLHIDNATLIQKSVQSIFPSLSLADKTATSKEARQPYKYIFNQIFILSYTKTK